MQIVHLLRQVDEPVMLITSVFFHSLDRFVVLLFDLIEDLLKLVEVETPPNLQLAMVSLRHLRRGSIIIATTSDRLLLLEDLLCDVAPRVRVLADQFIYQVRQVLLRRQDHSIPD